MTWPFTLCVARWKANANADVLPLPRRELLRPLPHLDLIRVQRPSLRPRYRSTTPARLTAPSTKQSAERYQGHAGHLAEPAQGHG